MNFEKRRALTFHFYKLESETSALSNEDTESVNSFQEIETDLVRDSSDTENFGSEYEVEYEYEVDSASGSDLNSSLYTSGDSDLEQQVLVAAAAICDSSFDKWVTDGEESEDNLSEDNSFTRKDFWTCLKCKSKKENPQFLHCEKCFQDRKTLFPPRPKPRKPKKTKTCDAPVKLDTLRSCLKGLSQDSGIGSSQECPPLGLDKIVIPEHLTGSTTTVSSSSSEGENLSSQQIVEENDKSSTSKQVTLNDIIKGNSTRKRQLSESSLSEIECKKPRWRDVKKSPGREQSPVSLSRSPVRKQDAFSFSPQKSISANGNSALMDPNDICCKTSDLGSEISSGSGISDKVEDLHYKDICIFCNTKPINAGFLHGNIAHRCCCYQCAKKTWKSIKRCPMCNRRVSNVIRVY